MQYISTRGATIGSYRDVLIEGLAADGGLAVPAALPRLDAALLERWRPLGYAELATEVLRLFATDIPGDELARICQFAYQPSAFAAEAIVPLSELDHGMQLVGLSEGPTLAFKDMAMRFLGEALDYVLGESNRVLNILGATSGDTGSAAEYALRGRERLAVFMLSPKGRMSAFQRAQMYSLVDDNVHNIVVDGVFDDCQNLVKRISEDVEFKQAHHLGAVNSINFGRISAQIVYYIWAWLRVTDELPAAERGGFEVSFSVPSGNFGNILSGYYARQMGLPVRKLVLATNENNVLDDFFEAATIDPDLLPIPSPPQARQWMSRAPQTWSGSCSNCWAARRSRPLRPGVNWMRAARSICRHTGSASNLSSASSAEPAPTPIGSQRSAATLSVAE